ncbi:similar to Saccharomyces cerevisiae YNL059C ARP5 Nuclear actin-related protein involved in chromatin remodeling, component of chromatin-remodeling enzyme complexes [Maudiozyma saulgeensis]|uniref:Similar to Saccharomyces cerevisiae YNL059C ARP5 Nuclear actin-related protein involved in chromatin remodeling, component of chromatin-remodeling enzyme complexes n=1 Tax=Maudiozyma saulgeensis TaxID=1789683 RepID=A0A1X7QZI2_9SACH|nr:similar to Saccharomyces cerevisiae YNL059C ARP5 Nuclear actin-related protein involved in chromatin remodeling, component of chromatin-remodeling enzyme complexes [Kazachstania saulgeensis]
MSRDGSVAPLKVTVLEDQPLREECEPFDSTDNYNPDTPIAVDFGSFNVRAGYVNQTSPTHVFINELTRYRDRKLARTFTFIGNDTLLDQTVCSQAKSPFDGSLITNWDYVEDIMEYTFNHLGVVSDNGVKNPLIINERLGCLASQRNNWYQILFESFNMSKVTFGVDSLFAYYANNDIGKDGIVIDCGNQDTNVIPIVGGKAVLTESKRVDWGGAHAVEFLSDVMTLKYPYFPTKLSGYQYRKMYEDYCYTSQNYNEDIDHYLTLDNLADKNVVIEAPFTEVLQPQKTEEELRIQAEKRKETGKRLQEQAKQKRIEKLIQKTEEYEYFSKVREQLVNQSKKAVLSILQNAGFDDERDFKKYMYNLEKSLKKAQAIETDGADDNNDEEEQKFNLVDIPDAELDEEQIKEKRKQRFLKASFDARQKAKEEKLRLQKEEEESRKREEEWRQTNLSGWIKDKRKKLAVVVKKRKDKVKLKEDMKDRKSQASQKRMKNLANLAEDTPQSGSKRSRQQATIDNDPNDTFGTNDDDWAVYNDVTQNPEALDELIEEDYREILDLESQLLEFDPNFTEEDTLDAQYDWRNSVLHLFLRGPAPHDGEDVHEQHQMHLNIERIRVPEILFQPSIGGLDQAGITELCETILLRKFDSKPSKLSQSALKMVSNTWLTGGNSRIPGTRERIVKEFTQFLPVKTSISVHQSTNPTLDAWNGMVKVGNNKELFEKTSISRKEYEEFGADYIKEHQLGNVNYF